MSDFFFGGGWDVRPEAIWVADADGVGGLVFPGDVEGESFWRREDCDQGRFHLSGHGMPNNREAFG